MSRCTAIKPNGERCTLEADGFSGLCWSHDPKHAEARRSRASRGGKATRNKEIVTLKAEVRDLIRRIETGEVPHVRGQVQLQGYRVLKELTELERKIKETDEVAAELRELKDAYGLS